jgi:TPR repeat protein
MMTRLILLLVLAFLLPGRMLLAATPEKRVALVIGNGAYQSKQLPALENPPHDAEDIAKALRGFGFDVILKTNVNRRDMKDAIAEFGRKASNADAAMFYFAGHGLQIKSQNYLMPIDASVRSEADAADESVNVNYPLEEMENAKARVNMVILDACRDNPISGKFRSAGGRGLAPPNTTPKGTVIVYATDPGNTASDGDGRNGLFTGGLLSAFKSKDLSLDGVLTAASAHVEQQSGGKQTPYVNGPQTTKKNFYFSGTAPAAPTAAPAAAAATGIDPLAVEMSFWDSVKTSADIEDFQEYLHQYPQGHFAGLARNRVKAMTATAPHTTSLDTHLAAIVDQAKGGNAAALSELSALAEKGDPAAQGSLGRLYQRGWGVTKDGAQALKWYRRAADKGNADGQTGLGNLYANGIAVKKDETEALLWFKKAADQGHARAQNALGNFNARGQSIPVNEAEAIKWYRKSAEQGYARAQFSLGTMLEQGKGTAKNDVEALKWFRLAAEQGDDSAEYKLAMMYFDGKGVPHDDAEAMNWLRKSVEKGNKLAEQTLAARSGTPRSTATVSPVSPVTAVTAGPKQSCADRPNFISRKICEKRECEKPANAKNPDCADYLNKQEPNS